jgi:hypothetical protein
VQQGRKIKEDRQPSLEMSNCNNSPRWRFIRNKNHENNTNNVSLGLLLLETFSDSCCSFRTISSSSSSSVRAYVRRKEGCCSRGGGDHYRQEPCCCGLPLPLPRRSAVRGRDDTNNSNNGGTAIAAAGSYRSRGCPSCCRRRRRRRPGRGSMRKTIPLRRVADGIGSTSR